MNLRQIIAVEKTDEAIFIFARPFILSFLPWLVMGLALVVIGAVFIVFVLIAFPQLVANDFQFNVFVVMSSSYFLLILPFFTVGFIDYYYDLFIVTDRRLLDIDQNSLFARKINELALEQVEDVSAETNGVFRSLFDYGDITVQSAGAKDKFIFNGILHPREVTEIVLDLADQAKQRIERGIVHIIPSGPAKGVIENKVYTSVADLYRVGAMVPHHPSYHAGEAANAAIEPPPPALSPDRASPGDENDLDIVIDSHEEQ